MIEILEAYKILTIKNEVTWVGKILFSTQGYNLGWRFVFKYI